MLDIDRLVDQLDLVALAGQAGAKLHKAGLQMRSTCPLHAGSDNPTSFCVHTPHGSDRQLWVCHKCGGGDALGFIMRWKGLDFIEAVQWAAQEARIPLADLGMTEQAVKEHQEREKRRDVLDLAARFYQRRFRKQRKAIDYALGRGFNPRTLTRFGYSNGRGLGEYLQAHHADMELAHKIGLLRADGRDWTCNSDGDQVSPEGWLVYLHRRAGRVDYLSARALSKVAKANDKSRNIPGTKQSYRAEATGDELLIVEGQADAETARQIGVSALAMCGTAIDDDSDTRRRKVYLALDDDEHREGTPEEVEERHRRHIERRKKLGDKLGPLTLMCGPLPNDKVKDLNEWIQFNQDLNRKDILGWMKQAQPWIDYRIQAAEAAGPLEQAEHISDVAHLLARLPDQLKPRYYKKAGAALNMTPAELKTAAGQDGRGPAADVREGQLCLYGVPLLTGSAWITREVTLSDGSNASKVQYAIQGRLRTGEPLRELQIEASTFESMSWMNEWGARLIKLVSRGRYHELARAIQEVSLANQNGASMKRENVFAHTGLATINGGERSFLTKTGRITPAGLDPATRIDLGESNLFYALPEPPKGADLVAAVRAAVDFLRVAPLRVTAPLFAAMCAAPLTSLRSLNTLIWVYGTTTTGKSIISHLALAFFAPGAIGPRRFQPMLGWNSTVTTLEAAMFAAKDCPLVIDDYAPQFLSKHEADKLKEIADRVIRSLGNRMARVRSRSDESVRRARNPRALVISTAENPIDGQSLNHRLVYVAVEKGDVIHRDAADNALLNQAEEQGAAGLYAQAMSAFIRWLLANWDKVADQFGVMVDADVAASRPLFASGLDRQPDYFAILNSAQRLALKAWADMGALDPLEAGRIADANRAALLQVVQGQAGRIAEQSPANMFIRAVDSLLDQRRAYLAPRKAMHDWSPPDRADRVGWFDPTDRGAIWLHIENALAVARRYWENLGIQFDVSRDSLKRLMCQSGMLRKTDGDRAEVAIWTGHRTERALEIDIQKVLADEAWGFDLSYPKPSEPSNEPGDEPPPPLIVRENLL